MWKYCEWYALAKQTQSFYRSIHTHTHPHNNIVFSFQKYTILQCKFTYTCGKGKNFFACAVSSICFAAEYWNDLKNIYARDIAFLLLMLVAAAAAASPLFSYCHLRCYFPIDMKHTLKLYRVFQLIHGMLSPKKAEIFPSETHPFCHRVWLMAKIHCILLKMCRWMCA